MFPNKWVIFWENKPIGIDENSGGYPYKSSTPSEVRYFNTKDEAQKYWDVMNYYKIGQYSQYEIKEIQFRIVS